MNTTPQIEVDNSEGGWSEVKMDVEEKQKPKVCVCVFCQAFKSMFTTLFYSVDILG